MISQFSVGQKITASGFNNNFGFVESEIDRFESIDPVPSGLICLWAEPSIPAGWLLCDGENGTPDLRDRFIVGVSEEYPLDSVGGSAESTLTEGNLPSHSHSSGSLLLEESGAHQHTLWQAGTNGIAEINTSGRLWVNTQSVQTGSSGNHEHTISGSLDNSGGGSPHDNLPPYYALYYIMKD